MCKFFNSYEEFPSEFALFPQNFTQLGKILQDRRSRRSRQISSLEDVPVRVRKRLLTRAVESESLEKSKNRKKSDKIGKIGSDFLSDFLAKMPKCHKLP